MIVSNKPGVETLAIYTLGGVVIELRHMSNTAASTTTPVNRRLHFRTRTMEALLIYLASQGRPLGREILAELLWPERTQEQARANLRLALHRLREQIAPYLLVTRQSVALNPDLEIFLDTTQFESHLAAGQLEAATALYRGDLLEGFYQDGSPTFEQWALLERERLRNLAIAAYQQLIDQSASAGQPDSAIAYAQRLLSLDSLHEPTHRQLMRLFAQAGQRNAALAQYERCRHLLTAELDVAPDEMTTALYQQIRHGQDSAAQEVAGARGETAAISDLLGVIDGFSHLPSVTQVITPVPHNLPLQPTPLIGRAAELAQIESLLANPDCRLLTLLGVGGIGKTRLAIEAAQRIVDSGVTPTNNSNLQIQRPPFADGLSFISLAPVARAELVAVTIAQALGVKATGSDLEAEIVAYLRPRAMLLVIDNFEHLVEAATLIAHLLQNAPRLKVLITSRERLYLREEWLLPVSGLSLAQGTAGEAGQLFLHTVQRVQPDFRASGQEDAIALVCRQVEGMPLALELAASWVRVMSCDEIARQIAENSTFLTTSLRNLPERHRSLRALFDQSWRLLSPLEQGVLMRLSVFAGGWLPEEAAPVTGATLALLLGLVDKSLVRVNGENRFDLHELVRQYAAEQLVASGEADLIHQRHYAAYLYLTRTADGYLRSSEAATWFARLQAEWDNVRAALQWASDQARFEDAAWLLVAANWFCDVRGYWLEAGKLFRRLLPQRQTFVTDLRLVVVIIYHYMVLRVPQEFAQVERFADELQQLLEQSAYKLLQATAWTVTAIYTSDFSKAMPFWERAIDLARAASEGPVLGPEFGLLHDREWMLASILEDYGASLLDIGEIARSTPLVMEALQLYRAQRNYYEVAACLGILGRVAYIQGDLAQADTLLQEAVTTAAAFNYERVVGYLQPIWGLVTLYRGDRPEARRLLEESLRLCLQLKASHNLSWLCIYLAELEVWEGKLEQAEQWLAQSLTYQTDLRRITIYEVERLFIAARLATAQQQYLRAATLIGLAEQAHKAVHHVIAGPMRLLADEALATVQSALDPALFAEAFSAGEHLSLDTAFATLLTQALVAGAHGES